MNVVKEPSCPGFSCVSCGARDHSEVLNLGTQPLCNAFTEPGSEVAAATAPVCLVMCTSCRLLQLLEHVEPSLLFLSYPWTSSSSQTTVAYAEAFARDLRGRLGERNSVLEIASNDGLLLRAMARVGLCVRGVEPSNLVARSAEVGIPTIHAFFDARLASSIVAETGPVDAVVARNVLGHVANVDDFIRGAAVVLEPSGLLVIEVPYAGFLRAALQYDTIFHEHVSYFTVATLTAALARGGFTVTRIAFNSLNGGSIVCDSRLGSGMQPGRVIELIERERAQNLNAPDGWASFARRVHRHRTKLQTFFSRQGGAGEMVMGYGAAAKTMMLLNFAGIGRDLLPAIGDANPTKWGLMTPGGGIPIVSPDELMAMRPSSLFLGPWNLSGEILHNLFTDYHYQGSVIVPLPRWRFFSAPPVGRAVHAGQT